MSNPAVITLANGSGKIRNLKRLCVEDNIGESIHLHVDNVRVDFTIKNFLAFSRIIRASLEELGIFKKYQLQNLDPHFLFEMSHLIKDIRSIEIKNYVLADLKSLVRVRVPKIGHVMMPRRINYSPAYQYLKGLDASFEQYAQHNYPGQDNVSRLKNLRDSVRQNGYPYKSNHIVLFGDQKLIRDGQHRAAILAAEGGLDQEVPVMVIHFRGNRWRHSTYRQLSKVLARKAGGYGWRKVRSVLQRVGYPD